MAAAVAPLGPWRAHRHRPSQTTTTGITTTTTTWSSFVSSSTIHGKRSRHRRRCHLHHSNFFFSVKKRRLSVRWRSLPVVVAQVPNDNHHRDNSSSRSRPLIIQQQQRDEEEDEEAATTRRSRHYGNGRVFFLDVNPICYQGSTPSLHTFARWLSLFFSQVAFRHPVIAVLDGEGGSQCRRRLLPSYKAHRWRRTLLRDLLCGDSHKELLVTDVLQKCHVPVVKVKGYEADDIIATLADQVLKQGYRVVIGSPDKDFKQLICEDVQMVMPIPEIGRWSFYTLKHYMAQYNCSPSSDLSLRSMLGDESDGVPGIQHLVPGFGRKTAMKLLKRHSSLENMLHAAAIRTVGRAYVQDALTRHADYLRRNYEVLSLRRDVDIQMEDSWLFERDSSNDSFFLSNFVRKLDLEQRWREGPL